MSAVAECLNWLCEPFEAGFMQRALAGALLAAISCSVVGVYVVLRRMAFFGGALTHTILPGIAFAFLRGWDLFWGALLAALATAFGVGYLARREDVREDSAIGVVLSGMFALGVVMMARVNSFRDLSSVLFGSVLGISTADIAQSALVTAVILLTLALFHKELLLSSVDTQQAQLIGARPERMHYLLLALVALAVVCAVQLVGALLSTALLITPAATAVLWTRSTVAAMIGSAAVGCVSAVAGLYVSYYADISPGAGIVLAATALFALSYVAQGIRRA